MRWLQQQQQRQQRPGKARQCLVVCHKILLCCSRLNREGKLLIISQSMSISKRVCCAVEPKVAEWRSSSSTRYQKL
ncbi:hypothetical protein HYC85_020175 [Camellia sinensis]|uniref:Uncharacterized protein n=1 Tax=Camellia sinensis TaxID=4442 RepID=A0A7J7GP13_CAMSI|nr:hypothetical protein HYC85_020175 [Camellia sinensis]